MKIKVLLLLIISAMCVMSCSSDDDYSGIEIPTNPTDPTDPTDPATPTEPNPLPSVAGKVVVKFFDPRLSTTAYYYAVKIGEYYWMDSNINHYSGQAMSRSQIDLALTRYRLNPSKYNVSIQNINKYFGPYYDRIDYEYIEGNRNNYQITEDGNLITAGLWGSPSNAEVAQLFAMCGNGSENSVRTALACKPGSNPAAINNYTYWFTSTNTNKFGFNLMPGGARFNGDQQWKLEHNHNQDDYEIFNVATGDFYGFLQAAVILTWNGRVTIDDYIKFDTVKSWHWMSIRWCRKLTNAELGYRLYIDQAQSDIVKLGLNTSPPNGYTELPNGALRGFYVQYIIEGANPDMTVPQMVTLAKSLPH
ncbi:hypothetical protein [Dysgonomonas macrotermitis]|uniref:Major paralogous domain-containing protein n=1 Tax=Dysgonomonas macrotermitis TaxID=1346286 RepID=A0A1M5BGU9_9BACT|nr:hypothetical protein [Dysgonomonas macrotermitis]SHF41823.1 major paralogous domain-containing protein [Dysgonomonas macrotermitis]